MKRKLVNAETSGDKAEDLTKDDSEGKADDSDRDDTDAEYESCIDFGFSTRVI
jgi:hypothetical protein